MLKILVVHGVNLNFLGTREPKIYGTLTLGDINSKIKERALEYGFEIEIFQSNHEGEIVDKIQEHFQKSDYLVINPAAFTHYSIAIRDAILATGIKTIEVHLSNVHSREDFRKKSVIADIAVGQIAGFSYYGYMMALDYIKEGCVK
ncbi:type II 3-dehydroquinate dehydratase [uncultured Ilyobacter sp.]|uniref:type II 3-dehydroquinate dehydratase n=1 Tax=uncultured Ilyobacter sp. TaxID=544433 RepID=UPI0029C9965B|nr:type II 3-dehydroquinate dehydratase [uncultured Ilyobacter sp.]